MSGIDTSVSIDRLGVLSEPRRVATLAALASYNEPVSVEALARRVAGDERGKSDGEVSDDEQRQVHVSLVHNHLPKLAAHALVEWDEAAGTVALARSVSATRLRRFVGGPPTVAAARMRRVLSLPRRRLVLAIVDEHGTPMTVDELTRLVASVETASSPGELSAHAVDRVGISLEHSHLPALSAAGVLVYDEAAKTVDRPDDLD
ncbi:DUF7344 domain-containing protein [Halovivax gelatinilyticus]|uniref:DUF7344 domain-containing protein n=1 Tax=Halovivax gelatinilyticus TaxID=2961597 RepID=UPI0020CA916A|nr:hypothetical protein [Halovivax gelatinilyticus]